MATAKQNFYKWHRILGLIALVPVIGWTLSGLSHPFMSNWFRPSIAREIYKASVTAKPSFSISQVLQQNGIKKLRNFGLITFNNRPYYQVLQADSAMSYYDGNTGSMLPDGDKLYAQYLARWFTQDSVSAIKNIVLQKTFDGAYQPINRLLPVWKVSFNRPDGMDIYIETGQSRMGTFNNNTRKVMLQVFQQLHTWEFLAAAFGDKFRLVVMSIIVSVMVLSLLSGLTIYGLFWKKFKSAAQNRRATGKKDTRFVHRFHRQLGLIVSFVMLTFSVSGGFHLLVKLHNISPKQKSFEQLFDAGDLAISNLELPATDSVARIGLVKYNGQGYYQVTNKNKVTSYYSSTTGKQLTDGDSKYAAYIAGFYRQGQPERISGKTTVTQIRQFTEEYGFINKRLPVQEVSYPNGENWYIETTTSQLSTKVAGIDRTEGFSFIFLHKYFGMTWAGKNTRDIVSMLAAVGVLIVSLFGFAAFIKNK